MERTSSTSSVSSCSIPEKPFEEVLTDGRQSLKDSYLYARSFLGSNRVSLRFKKYGVGKSDDPKDALLISKDLCIVKTCRGEEPSGAMAMRKEASMVSRIFQSEIKESRKKFPELTDTYDRPTDKDDLVCIWLAIRFPSPSVTLARFRESWESIAQAPIPYEFLSHVYAELYDIIEHLSQRCNIVHNAIDGTKILLDFSNSSKSNPFPSLRLIDFDKGHFAMKEESYEKDLVGVCNATWALIETRHGKDQKWDDSSQMGFEEILVKCKDGRIPDKTKRYRNDARTWGDLHHEKMGQIYDIAMEASKQFD